jgi:hypothetical protein
MKKGALSLYFFSSFYLMVSAAYSCFIIKTIGITLKQEFCHELCPSSYIVFIVIQLYSSLSSIMRRPEKSSLDSMMKIVTGILPRQQHTLPIKSVASSAHLIACHTLSLRISLRN